MPSFVLVILTWVAGCDGGLSLTLFVIAGTLRGLSLAMYMAAPVDIAPDYAGTILGIGVCVGNMTGFLVPWVTGLLTEKDVSPPHPFSPPLPSPNRCDRNILFVLRHFCIHRRS